jgi:hypothetical protein
MPGRFVVRFKSPDYDRGMRPHFLRIAQALTVGGSALFGGPCPSPTTCQCQVADTGVDGFDNAYLYLNVHEPDGATRLTATSIAHDGACTSGENDAGCVSYATPAGPLPPPEIAA